MSRTPFDLYRPVTNFPESANEALHTRAVLAGVEPTDIRIVAGPNSRVTILNANNIDVFLGNMGISRNAIDLGSLGDYLDDNMPVSADEDVAADTYPVEEIEQVRRRRAGNDTWLFTIANNDPVVVAERMAARALTEQFLGITEQDTAMAWHDVDYTSSVWLARTRGVEAADAFSALLAEEDGLLPAHLMLGAVVLNDQ